MARTGFAALVALSLALRLLSPAGFMPAFDHGAVTIVFCPDAGAGVASGPAHRHHPGNDGNLHQICPYAAASSLDAFAIAWTPPIARALFAAELPAARAVAALQRERSNRRPPPTGPPLRS